MEDPCQRAQRSPEEVGEALQRASGLDAKAAASAQQRIPTTLQPDREGAELLIGLRRDHGLPGAGDPFDDLVQTGLVAP